MLAAALSLAAAPAAVLFLASASAAAGQMTLYSLASGDSFIELGGEGGVGDTTVWNSELQDEQRKKIGTTTGSCVRVDAEGNHLCSIVVDHHGHGRMSLHGVQRVEPRASTLTIIGGTDAYQGITGTIRSTPVEERARFRYEVDYRID